MATVTECRSSRVFSKLHLFLFVHFVRLRLLALLCVCTFFFLTSWSVFTFALHSFQIVLRCSCIFSQTANRSSFFHPPCSRHSSLSALRSISWLYLVLWQAHLARERTGTSNHACLYARRSGDGPAMSWAATHGAWSSHRRPVPQPPRSPLLAATEILGEFVKLFHALICF